jgi:hypothetical protein
MLTAVRCDVVGRVADIGMTLSNRADLQCAALMQGIARCG